MDDTAVLHLALQTLIVAAKVSAPVLLTSIVIGFGISLVQSATQLQEVTLTFVPKLVGVGIALALTGRWALDTLVDFTHQLYTSIPSMLG